MLGPGLGCPRLPMRKGGGWCGVQSVGRRGPPQHNWLLQHSRHTGSRVSVSRSPRTLHHHPHICDEISPPGRQCRVMVQIIRCEQELQQLAGARAIDIMYLLSLSARPSHSAAILCNSKSLLLLFVTWLRTSNSSSSHELGAKQLL